MSHLTQMAGLTVQNFVSAAVGMAVAVALDPRPVRRRARRRSGTSGSTSRATTSASCCRCRVRRRPGAREPGRRAELPRARRTAHDRRGRDPVDPRRPGRQPGGHQAARAPTAAGSSTRTRPTRSRTPTAFTNLSSCCAAPAHPVRAHVHLRPDGQDQRQGWAVVRGDVRPLARRGRRRHVLRGERQPELAARPDGAARRREHGGQGGPLRPRRAPALFAAATTGTSTGSVNSPHDSFTPLGGAVPLVNMMLGEVSPGGVGAGLYGMLVFAILVGVHRRADGRPHTGVPRQEDPGGRDEAGRAVHPRRCRSSCSASRRRRCARLGGLARSSTRARTGSPRSSTPSRRPPTTTARPSAASPATPTGTTRRSASRCSSAASS